MNLLNFCGLIAISLFCLITKQQTIKNLAAGNIEKQIYSSTLNDNSISYRYTVQDKNKVQNMRLLAQCKHQQTTQTSQITLEFSIPDTNALPAWYGKPQPQQINCPTTFDFIQDNFYSSVQFICEFYNICSFDIVLKKNTSSTIDYHILILEEYQYHVLSPVNLNLFIPMKLLFPYPKFTPNQSPKTGYYAVVEQRFVYYNATSDLSLHIDDTKNSYFKIQQQKNGNLDLNNLNNNFADFTLEERSFFSNKASKFTDRSKVRMFNAKGGLLQIQICFNSNHASANSQQNYLFQSIEEKTMGTDLVFTSGDLEPYHTLKLKSSQFERFMQISMNATTQKTKDYFKFAIDIPQPYSEANQIEYKFRRDDMLYRYLYSNPNFNSTECFLHIYSKLKDIGSYHESLLLVKKSSDIGLLELYEKSTSFKLKAKYIETDIAFNYKAGKGITLLQFKNTLKGFQVFVNECQNNNVDKCVIPSKENHKYKAVVNQGNLNQFVDLKKNTDSAKFFSILVQADINWVFRGETVGGSRAPYKNTDEPPESEAQQKYYQSQLEIEKLFVTDVYLFRSPIPSWAYVFIIEIIICLALIFMCTGIYYIDFGKLYRSYLKKYEAIKEKIQSKIRRFRRERSMVKSQNITSNQ